MPSMPGLVGAGRREIDPDCLLTAAEAAVANREALLPGAISRLEREISDIEGYSLALVEALRLPLPPSGNPIGETKPGAPPPKIEARAAWILALTGRLEDVSSRLRVALTAVQEL